MVGKHLVCSEMVYTVQRSGCKRQCWHFNALKVQIEHVDLLLAPSIKQPPWGSKQFHNPEFIGAIHVSPIRPSAKPHEVLWQNVCVASAGGDILYQCSAAFNDRTENAHGHFNEQLHCIFKNLHNDAVTPSRTVNALFHFVTN